MTIPRKIAEGNPAASSAQNDDTTDRGHFIFPCDESVETCDLTATSLTNYLVAGPCSLADPKTSSPITMQVVKKVEVPVIPCDEPVDSCDLMAASFNTDADDRKPAAPPPASVIGTNGAVTQQPYKSDLRMLSFNESPVRVRMIGDEYRWVARDIVEALGCIWTGWAIWHVPNQLRRIKLVQTDTGTQKMVLLSDRGLLYLLGESTSPIAFCVFQWLITEVLPFLGGDVPTSYVPMPLNPVLKAPPEIHSIGGLVSLNQDGPVVSTLTIAQGTENDHASVIKLVRVHIKDLEEFGLLDFKSTSTGGRPTEFALLNESQATLLFMFTRNTEAVCMFKVKLIHAFFAMRDMLRGRYLAASRLQPELHMVPEYLAATSKALALQAKHLEDQGAQVDRLFTRAMATRGLYKFPVATVENKRLDEVAALMGVHLDGLIKKLRQMRVLLSNARTWEGKAWIVPNYSYISRKSYYCSSMPFFHSFLPDFLPTKTNDQVTQECLPFVTPQGVQWCYCRLWEGKFNAILEEIPSNPYPAFLNSPAGWLLMERL